uniref:uncharacterized protein LOC101312069 isoform X2 n=1 Tax=Fragaria vesca subsp. vesca TaxID=101020 RepID=UPI0005CA43BE|nr:PREDICTED: uncharacterized protein LOC101312069 isoform X2 [Fragaria vesca subsp. vesca]
MASPPSYIQTLDDRSHFKPTVSLYDWWLVKSEDNDGKSKLAVAGVSSAPQEIPRRVFNSAPISKKHDVFTLETTDGVTVILDGIINKQQTIANGFSDEIAKRFQLGFYPGWEKGVAEFLAGDCNTTVVSGRISDSGSEGEGKKDSSPTSVHFSQEETRTPYEHVGSTYFQWNGTSKNLEGNQRNPMSGCSMKHRSSKLLPLSDAFENVGEASGVAVQSGGKMSEAERCPSNSARWVTRFLSEFWSKWTNQQMVGNSLNSEKKTTDSVLTVSKTVINSSQTDESEVGEKEGSHEQVSCEEIHDSEFSKQLSSRLSLNNSINDMVNHAVEEETGTDDMVNQAVEEETGTDDMVNQAVEEETGTYDFISTALQSIGIPKTLEENEKNPESGCSIKHNSTNFSPSVDVGVVVSGVTVPLEGETNLSKISPRNPGGRVFGDLSIITRSKGKTKQIVGSGLDSEQNTVDSVPAVESVSNTSENVDYEVGGRQMFELFLSCCERAEGLINSSQTSVHFAHETPNKKVHCEDRLDVEDPTQITLSSDSTIDDSKVDNLMNHAAEVELDAENIGLTEFQSFGRPQTRDESEKNPASEPAAETLEILDEALDVNAQSGEKRDISVGSSSQFAGRVSLLFSGIIQRKEKKKQTVGNGLNSETKTIDSVPVVSGSVSNPLENDSFETAGNWVSHPSDSELQEPVDVNVVRKLDFDFVEDDMQQTSNAEEGQDFGNVKAQVREGKSGAKGEIKSRKRNMRQVTVDTQEIHSIPEVNKKNNRTPSTLEVKKKKDGTPKANTKKRQVSASLEGSKMRTSTPSTLEVNNKEKVSLSTTKVYTRKRKVSPSTSDVSKKNKSSPLTLEMNNKKEATLPSPKVTAYTSLISPESLSAGRSRSGRLRLRPLEFWRNQSAVYDKDHGVIGIQEEIPRVTPSRGSFTEPRKRKGNRG